MVDFTNALKARVEGMSSEDLKAAEDRRTSREAEQADPVGLDAVWEPTTGDQSAAVVKPVTLSIDSATAGMPVALKVAQGSSFHETILLTPAVYRLIAGGQDGDAKHASALTDRFIVHAGTTSHHRVSVDREALAAIVGRERPVDLARARRLLDKERHTPAMMRLRPDKRIALFIERWYADVVNVRLDEVVAKVSSRVILMLAGHDQVALWVRRADFVSGSASALSSDLAPAILRPTARAPRPNPAIPGSPSSGADCYLRDSHGTGPERMLLLDLARFRKIVCALEGDCRQQAALASLEQLITRSNEIAQERHGRLRRARSLPKLTQQCPDRRSRDALGL